MEDKLYCIKMLSRVGRHHLCGAERLGIYEEIDKISQELLQRAVAKGKGQLDSVQLNVAKLEHFNFRSASLPDFIQIRVKSYREGRNTARNLLSQMGVSSKAYHVAEDLLKRSPEMGGASISGAYLLDSFSGEILNYDMEEGVWIGRVDLADPVEAKLRTVLQKLGLDGPKIRDNLVLSGKIMGMPGFVGEINWSNDSSEPGGSISTAEMGCVYFPFLRSNANEVGGRAVFVRGGFDLGAMVRYLESEVLLIDSIGIIR
jgi:6-carboxyhexanoate--CoA ligase